ncbi:TolB family protein [Shewanella sp. GXUN23E]|uniref:TolB family protein n=1 Tax=Shewanella sp. GXUN23E TaxID=3422498 RepID=UPI003D7CD84D
MAPFHLRPAIPALFVCLLAPVAQADGLDIFLYPLSFADNQWQVGTPIPLTDRPGYDSQPAFTADSKALLFSSDRSGRYTDIYQIDLADKRVSQLTRTPDEGEFSPTPLPGTDGIRYVVEQGIPHQSVWQQQAQQPRSRAINSYIPTGYYASHPQLGTLLWARYGYNLYFEPTGEQADEGHFVAAGVGRSLHAIPNAPAFSFIHKRHDGQLWVTRFEPHSGSQSQVIALSPGSEDISWSSNGWIFHTAAQGLMAYKYNPDIPTGLRQWQQIMPLNAPADGYQAPNRLAISPDDRWLAIVWQRSSRPDE